MGHVNLKIMAIATVIGILMSFATGFVENRNVIGIPEMDYYGYPLIWRSTYFLQQPQTTYYNFTNLALDTTFWIMISLVVAFVLGKMLRSSLPSEATTPSSA